MEISEDHFVGKKKTVCVGFHKGRWTGAQTPLNVNDIQWLSRSMRLAAVIINLTELKLARIDNKGSSPLHVVMQLWLDVIWPLYFSLSASIITCH